MTLQTIKNHFDKAFNHFHVTFNFFVEDIKSFMKAINHYVEELKYSVKTFKCSEGTINHSEETIKCKILHSSALQTLPNLQNIEKTPCWCECGKCTSRRIILYGYRVNFLLLSFTETYLKFSIFCDFSG